MGTVYGKEGSEWALRARSCPCPRKVSWTGDGGKEGGRPLTTSSLLVAATNVFVPQTDPASWEVQSPQSSAGVPGLCTILPNIPWVLVLTWITWWPKGTEFFICGLAVSVAVFKMRWPFFKKNIFFFFFNYNLGCFHFILFYFLAYCMSCGNLVPQPEIEPGPSAVRVWSPNHWTAREFPRWPCICHSQHRFLSSLQWEFKKEEEKNPRDAV